MTSTGVESSRRSWCRAASAARMWVAYPLGLAHQRHEVAARRSRCVGESSLRGYSKVAVTPLIAREREGVREQPIDIALHFSKRRRGTSRSPQVTRTPKARPLGDSLRKSPHQAQIASADDVREPERFPIMVHGTGNQSRGSLRSGPGLHAGAVSQLRGRRAEEQQHHRRHRYHIDDGGYHDRPSRFIPGLSSGLPRIRCHSPTVTIRTGVSVHIHPAASLDQPCGRWPWRAHRDPGSPRSVPARRASGHVPAPPAGPSRLNDVPSSLCRAGRRAHLGG
jgi:hypothetical protein